MLTALYRAIADLGNPALRRIITMSLSLAVAGFMVLWVGLAILLGHVTPSGWRYVDWTVDLLGGLTVLALTWLLFPAVGTLVMGCFLDRIAREVEAADYPLLPSARPVSVAVTLTAMLRLTAATIILNLLALPLYLLFPVANVVIFAALNGYLLGREYFEVVALRRLEPVSVRRVRHRLAIRWYIGGVVIAGLFAVPVVNLIAPVVATAFMVHLFEGWRRTVPHLTAF
ncbi:MAG: EI24 domain-containing protein [Alphaproteobacteria bacterium]|nr:EI24 domain-containing protein [Alphaproteobacteria bacterium]